jgi:hypothetical protein
MFAFADPEHVTEVLTAAGWAPPSFEKLDMDLDIAAGRGLQEGASVRLPGAMWLISSAPA